MEVDSTPDRFVLPTNLRQFSNLAVWGTTLRSVDCFKMEYLGNSRDGVGLYAGGTILVKPKIQKFGGHHRIDSMQAARCEVDGGAGGPDR